MKNLFLSIALISIAFGAYANGKEYVKFEKDGHFYIHVVINDSIEGRFLFDTGADGLYLDSTFVSRHNSIIKSDLHIAKMRGAGSTDYQQVFIINDPIKAAVGDYSHHFAYAPILKLTDIGGEDIAGIIGNEFIKNQMLIIDNEKLQLKIDTVVNEEEYETIIPFQYNDGRIYFPVDLILSERQTVTTNLMMDLGCANSVILNSFYFKALKNNATLPENIIDYTILYGGALGGNSDGGDFRIHSIKLGNDIIKKPIISFSKDTLGAFSKTNYDGLLGNEILDRYNYAIDYHNQKLYLIKNANSKKPFISSLIGFHAMKTNDVAVVTFIYYQSEAYKNGIRLGDTIVSINNKEVKTLPEQDFYNEMNEEGKQVKLVVLRNDKPVEISFQLKYLLE